jgi:membrane associated rhomboid family serine protease
MAPTVATILGNNSFVALYLSAGVISSAVSIWWHGKEYYGSHGASGTFCRRSAAVTVG